MCVCVCVCVGGCVGASCLFVRLTVCPLLTRLAVMFFPLIHFQFLWTVCHVLSGSRVWRSETVWWQHCCVVVRYF